jgi:hypothetical protein
MLRSLRFGAVCNVGSNFDRVAALRLRRGKFLLPLRCLPCFFFGISFSHLSIGLGRSRDGPLRRIIGVLLARFTIEFEIPENIII